MALSGISGSLASADLLAVLNAGSVPIRRLRGVLARARQALGPASSARAVFDLQMRPLVELCGLEVTVVTASSNVVIGTVSPLRPAASAVIAAGGWGSDLRRLRDRSTREVTGPRWWIGGNGLELRLMDAARAFTRRALDFDLQRLEDEDAALGVLGRLLSPRDGRFADLEALLAQSGRHRVEVGRSLQAGVDEALTKLMAGFASARRRTPATAFDDALTVVYRILFLLFAEARGLVPQWHPIYRDSYTIESLRPVAEGRGSPAGLWESLQAIARLAHRGCTAGTLRVVPFNGRLFAPATAPLADSFRLDDGVARDVLLAVTTRPGVDRRERIGYGDLGVEQLGAVYERVLDYTPAGERRKSSGTFYTPRAMTEYLVRRTLAPLVRGKRPEEILALRVLDPSMGSGAFLVAACRYLADAYEEALISEGTVVRADLTVTDRARFRRAIAQRCLYGVDINPTAVQLARLSLWLCTLAADRPLSFLDHHLRAGNSLVGASGGDLARQPPGRGRRSLAGPLPLFESEELSNRLAAVVDTRVAMARLPDDSAAVVRSKEREIDDLSGSDGPLARWRTLFDAWCATWFWPGDIAAVGPRAWPAFASTVHGDSSGLPPAVERQWRSTVARVAAEQRFFHWELEFPEVFFDPDGSRSASAGFDAVIGNPPWADARAVAGFSRESGCYHLHGRGHANLYQLFAERMLQLAAAHGRIGILMPSGFLADHGCSDLRRHLFDRCAIDAVLGFDNRDGLFPIHRALRFSLITLTKNGSTTALRSRFGLRSAAVLEDVPDEGDIPGSLRVPVTLLRRFSGEGLAVPELEHARDQAILARILAIAPPLGAAGGWGAHFGRELNATDDRRHFGTNGLPIIEGKHLAPFQVNVGQATQFIEQDVAERLLRSRMTARRARLGYREVASSTNRLTLIAAVIPAGVLTTHTVFCLREPTDEPLHWYLCGMLNSFTANYLARLRGGTHVPAAAIHQLPVPFCERDSTVFSRIGQLARVAATDPMARAEIHARSARAYGLSTEDFVRVVGTFPLVDESERAGALDEFHRLGDEI